MSKRKKPENMDSTTEVLIEKTVCLKEGHNFDSMQQQMGIVSICRRCGKAIVNTMADVRNMERGKK